MPHDAAVAATLAHLAATVRAATVRAATVRAAIRAGTVFVAGVGTPDSDTAAFDEAGYTTAAAGPVDSRPVRIGVDISVDGDAIAVSMDRLLYPAVTPEQLAGLQPPDIWSARRSGTYTDLLPARVAPPRLQQAVDDLTAAAVRERVVSYADLITRHLIQQIDLAQFPGERSRTDIDDPAQAWLTTYLASHAATLNIDHINHILFGDRMYRAVHRREFEGNWPEPEHLYHHPREPRPENQPEQPRTAGRSYAARATTPADQVAADRGVPAGGIDDLTATLEGLCACPCRTPLDPDGPSAYFATQDCQREWTRSTQAHRPDDVEYQPDPSLSDIMALDDPHGLDADLPPATIRYTRTRGHPVTVRRPGPDRPEAAERRARTDPLLAYRRHCRSCGVASRPEGRQMCGNCGAPFPDPAFVPAVYDEGSWCTLQLAMTVGIVDLDRMAVEAAVTRNELLSLDQAGQEHLIDRTWRDLEQRLTAAAHRRRVWGDGPTDAPTMVASYSSSWYAPSVHAAVNTRRYPFISSIA